MIFLYRANEMASVAVLMSVLWIFEAIPLPLTALIPLILFPIYGRFPMDALLLSIHV